MLGLGWFFPFLTINDGVTSLIQQNIGTSPLFMAAKPESLYYNLARDLGLNYCRAFQVYILV